MDAPKFASASPGVPSGIISATVIPKFTTNAHAATRTGVRVSFIAWNPRVASVASEKNGIPSAHSATTGVVSPTAVSSNCPCSNNTRTIGSRSTTSPSAAGTVIAKISRSPCAYACPIPSRSPCAASRAIRGNNTVANAIVNIPSGSSINRDDAYNTVRADSFNHSAKHPDTNMFTCVIEAPNNPGKNNRFISLNRGDDVQSIRGRQSARHNCHPGNPTCNTPPINTPAHCQYIFSSAGAVENHPITSANIIAKFSHTCDIADTVKCPSMFNAANNAAAMHTSSKYGISTTPNSKPQYHRSANPGIFSAAASKPIPTTTSAASVTSSRVSTWFKNRNASARPSWWSASDNTGMNADVSAPSPSSRRNKFGNCHANTNAEFIAPTPNSAYDNESRANPSTRDPSVETDTTNTFCKCFAMRKKPRAPSRLPARSQRLPPAVSTRRPALPAAREIPLPVRRVCCYRGFLLHYVPD